MKYILFVGSRLGFEALYIMTEMKCDIEYVFIEKEHEHEHIKYYCKSKSICIESNIPYKLNATKNEVVEIINMSHKFDYLMCFGYRRMIDNSLLLKPAIASLGTHFSPLPRYRGFAPLNWVLINDEKETAVNLFFLGDKVDSGDIICKKDVEITYDDDINSLYRKCIEAFKEMMYSNISTLENNSFKALKQDDSLATYTCSRNPDDGLINWSNSSRSIYNLARALVYPFSGAFTYIENSKIIIRSCKEYSIPKYEGVIPGKVIKIIKDQGIVVLCGTGAIHIEKIELDNGSVVNADEYINSVRINLG